MNLLMFPFPSAAPPKKQSLVGAELFLARLVLQEREPTPERVDRALRARPAAENGFRGCNMELGYEEAEITTACPPLPRRAVGFPPGAV